MSFTRYNFAHLCQGFGVKESTSQTVHQMEVPSHTGRDQMWGIAFEHFFLYIITVLYSILPLHGPYVTLRSILINSTKV